jgi:hypothetical protein
MVIKQAVYTKRFDLKTQVFITTTEWSSDRHGSDSDGYKKDVEFYITIQQLALYLNEDFKDWEVATQVTYLQAIYDNWSIDLYDLLFEDKEFLYFMYQDYGHNQSL